MKKLLSIIMSFVIIGSMAIPASAKDISVKLNGNNVYFDVAPQIINDRTMVPMRAIFEALGYSVSWDGNSKKITANGSGGTVTMTIGNKTFYKNNTSYTSDVAPTIINGRTLVPLRALGEALNYDVSWNPYHSIAWIYPMSTITMEQAISIAKKDYKGNSNDFGWYIYGLSGDSYIVIYATSPYYEPDYGGGAIYVNKNNGNIVNRIS